MSEVGLGHVGRMRARSLAELAVWDSLGPRVEDRDPWRFDVRAAVEDAAERVEWEPTLAELHAAENIAESTRRQAIKHNVQRFRQQ